MTNSLSQWQMAGFIFTSIAGTLLHFLFELSGERLAAALVSGVNESIWEHMKLLYFPMLIFALVQRTFVKVQIPGFWQGKLAGFTLGLALIPTVYYTYTGMLGVNADWFNITIFFIAAAAAFRLETHRFRQEQRARIPTWLALGLILGVGFVFVLFTFFPPHLPLFRDPVTGSYGFTG